MPTQKVFKQRVRARMTKTGESYTAARHQLLKKAAEPATPPPAAESTDPAVAAETTQQTDNLTSDEAMVRATGRGHDEWFALLDARGATERKHPEIAGWLREMNVPGWWAQNITVAYERARGMRARYQQADGFTISVTRSVDVPPAKALAAFTSASLRRRWLPDAPMRERPTKAKLTARFDWSDPASRVVVTIIPKTPDKSTVAVGHEQLPDAESAERLKAAWRASLGDLKAFLEAGNV